MKLIDLTSSHLTCRIAPEFGGAVYSFDYRASGLIQPLMRDTATTKGKHITDFACWPLVPFSNRIKSGKFSFDGQDYSVPPNQLGSHIHVSHGHGCENRWRVTQQDAAYCDMTFELNDSKIWPFPYKAEQKFSLDDAGLTICLSVTNTGDRPMPAGLGLHPYFPCTAGTKMKAQVSHLWEVDELVIPSRRIQASHQYFAENAALDAMTLDNCFDGWDGVAEITWPHQPMKLTMVSSENMRRLIVYIPQGETFFCAEPVSHMPDAVNRMQEVDTGLVALRPGATLMCECRFGILANATIAS